MAKTKGDKLFTNIAHQLGTVRRDAERTKQQEAKKRMLQKGTVIRLSGTECTKLVYPYDVPTLGAKIGTTFNPLTRKHENVTVSQYIDTAVHLKKTLVLFGPGGNMKTPIAEVIAKELTIAYDTGRYIKVSGPEAAKGVQDEFDTYVTVILEEFSPDDVAQHGRKLSANYLKQLLDVTNGGQVRVRNVMLNFKPLQPRIICTNTPKQEWLKAVAGVKDWD